MNFKLAPHQIIYWFQFQNKKFISTTSNIDPLEISTLKRAGKCV